MLAKLCIVTLLAALWLANPLAAEASSYKNVDTASPQDIVDGMANKGVRGVANILTGWMELPKQIYITGEKDGWLQGSVIRSAERNRHDGGQDGERGWRVIDFFCCLSGFLRPVDRTQIRLDERVALS